VWREGEGRVNLSDIDSAKIRRRRSRPSVTVVPDPAAETEEEKGPKEGTGRGPFFPSCRLYARLRIAMQPHRDE